MLLKAKAKFESIVGEGEGENAPENENYTEKNETQKIEASILIPWGFIVSIAHFPGAEGFDFPSPFDSEIGFK